MNGKNRRIEWITGRSSYNPFPDLLRSLQNQQIRQMREEKINMPTKSNVGMSLPFTFVFKPVVQRHTVDRILKSGPVTIVFWQDGTKTLVRRAPDEEDNDYAAFTAALAIKMYGSNSALKRMLRDKVEIQKPKKSKKTGCTDTCPIDFETIERNLKAKNNAT